MLRHTSASSLFPNRVGHVVFFLQVYMPGFLSSNLYYKYLSDLINSVRADEFVNVSSSGQGGMADSERSGSNANESSQIQVNQSLGHIFFPWRDRSSFVCWHLPLFRLITCATKRFFIKSQKHLIMRMGSNRKIWLNNTLYFHYSKVQERLL